MFHMLRFRYKFLRAVMNLSLSLLLSVVTGASDGIGKEYATHLARVHRLNVVLISRSMNKLAQVAKEIGDEFIHILTAIYNIQ